MELSSLMQFINRYKNSKLNNSTLKKMFDSKVDKNDFDGNKIEVWNWFAEQRKSSSTVAK